MLNEYIQRHQGNAILAAIVTSALALVGSLLQVYLTYYYTGQVQDRQVKIEQVSKFDGSSAELIAAAGAFINAINANDTKDLDAAKKQLNAALATQVYSVESLNKFYGGDVGKLVQDYQKHIAEFSQTSQKTSKATEMRIWSESFGRVLDSRATLSSQLHRALGNRQASI